LKKKDLKNTIIKILKIIIPLGIGIYLTWYFYVNLSEEEKLGIPKAFSTANYFWVFLSLLIAWASHYSRSYRWKYQLEHLGYKAKVSSMYHSVMIGYIINLTVPRSGEFARAGFFAKKENLPFDKILGTIVAERVIDVVMLLSIMGITTLYVGGDVIKSITKPKFEQEILITESIVNTGFIASDTLLDGEKMVWTIKKDISEEITKGSTIVLFNGEVIYDVHAFLKNNIGKKVIIKGVPTKKSSYLIYIILGLMLFGAILFFTVKKIKNFVLDKIKGLWEGGKSILFLEKKGAYILHTIFIWTCYVAMFWICAQGVGGVQDIGLDAVLVCFVVGATAIAATPGGIGLYPIFVSAALIYFGISKGDASGFSILMWVVQTLFLVVFGLISLFAINVKFNANEVDNKN